LAKRFSFGKTYIFSWQILSLLAKPIFFWLNFSLLGKLKFLLGFLFGKAFLFLAKIF
jgi:hypothetical protein